MLPLFIWQNQRPKPFIYANPAALKEAAGKVNARIATAGTHWLKKPLRMRLLDTVENPVKPVVG
jgi:hypothetical protein